ncbi:transcriptional regulator, ArsR family [Pseudonocardia thermophila]|uniref:Transcriptional regulator, ArsR family n=1 Tax=Pseudonocardia thermophila TaxID=1848 RepID=A0A1M6YD48_PSETH|nr:metalloregulator ArsR/SmtB family transcription factor [Pseudonocardia thermophila]SHL16234.1 transcriptional regulator, ArsR family [Pseudonocardia thermophila]
MTEDAVFLALADPVRRRLLELLAEGPRTAGDLGAQFDLSRPAVAEHLQVLRRAELVRDVPHSRTRTYHLVTEPLAQVGEWLHPFEKSWRARLRTFTDVVEESGAERDEESGEDRSGEDRA